MSRYIKFYLIAAVLLALPCYMAITGDTFSTAVAALPAFLFFAYRFIGSLVKALRKRETKYHAVITVSSLILIISLSIPVQLSDHGLKQLTQKRIQTIKELKPVFVKYYTEEGRYPKTLKDLVPAYIQVIPGELMDDGATDPYRKISYKLEKDQPIFHFRTHRGPDSAASLNPVDGTFRHDK
jgi:hypothetical protein